MVRILNVYLLEKLAGKLKQDDSGSLSFKYLTEYLESENPLKLSISLPLLDKEFDDKTSRAFFSGLLPDDRLLINMAKYLGISPNNSFALLEAVGGECAGAISLYPEGMIPERREDEYKILNEKDLEKVLKMLQERPLMVGEDGLRLSLAGAQDKLAVKLVDNQIALIKGNTPTSHILKPVISNISESVHNELFCMHLAHKAGISVPKTEIRWSKETPYILIERYDRIKYIEGKIKRVHQEDFCQAMIIPPEMKYEREGGPDISQCLNLIDNNTKRPAVDRLSFIRMIIFNYVIGNADAHGKNFSLLYNDLKPDIAPAYDILSTAVYPSLSKKMAMKIGGKYDPNVVLLRHWYRIIGDKAAAKSLIEKELQKLAKNLPDEAYKLKKCFDDKGIKADIIQNIIEIIEIRTTKILKYF